MELAKFKTFMLMWPYLITSIKFSPPSLQLFALFCEVHILVKSLLVDMTKLLQLLIAVIEHLLQLFLVFPFIPRFWPKTK